MGRPRKKDTHLPKCVHHRHGAYYLVKGRAWTALGKDLASALAEYARRHEAPVGGMGALIEEALPAITRKVAAGTKRQYRYAANILKTMLAEFTPELVKQRHMARVKLDLADRPNQANQCLVVARLVFGYAVENQLLDENPVVGIKPYPASERERLITPDEFKAIYAHADPQLQVIMDLLYLTGQRVKDVLTLRIASITPEGIYFKQQKTGARLRVQLNPEIEAVIERAKALHGNIRALTLLHNRRGKAPDLDTVRARWIAACALAGVEDAQLRDLRAMSGTAVDAQGGDAQRLLGHANEKMTERYLRAKQIKQVEGPSFGQSRIVEIKKVENQ